MHFFRRSSFLITVPKVDTRYDSDSPVPFFPHICTKVAWLPHLAPTQFLSSELQQFLHHWVSGKDSHAIPAAKNLEWLALVHVIFQLRMVPEQVFEYSQLPSCGISKKVSPLMMRLIQTL